MKKTLLAISLLSSVVACASNPVVEAVVVEAELVAPVVVPSPVDVVSPVAEVRQSSSVDATVVKTLSQRANEALSFTKTQLQNRYVLGGVAAVVVAVIAIKYMTSHQQAKKSVYTPAF